MVFLQLSVSFFDQFICVMINLHLQTNKFKTGYHFECFIYLVCKMKKETMFTYTRFDDGIEAIHVIMIGN